MDLIIDSLLNSLIIVGLLFVSFLLLSFKYRPLEKYREKAIELALWLFGILSAFFIFDGMSNKRKKSEPVDVEKRLNKDLDKNKREFHDKIKNPDKPSDLADRGRDLAERLRRR